MKPNDLKTPATIRLMVMTSNTKKTRLGVAAAVLVVTLDVVIGRWRPRQETRDVLAAVVSLSCCTVSRAMPGVTVCGAHQRGKNNAGVHGGME